MDGNSISPGLRSTTRGRQLASLAELEVLVRHSDLGDAGLGAAARMPKLVRLDLTGSDVTDAGLASIGRMAGLEELRLSYGRFTDKGVLQLSSLKKLRRLDLVRRVADEGARRCRKSHDPNLDYERRRQVWRL
jgi:hypothetical protein